MPRFSLLTPCTRIYTEYSEKHIKVKIFYLQVLFNRSSGWIGWQESDCGPNSRITGPYNYSTSLLSLCQLKKTIPDTEVTIKAAQWALCAFSIVAVAVLIYLLAPCVKALIVRPLPRSQQISLSQAALFEPEVNSN